MSDTIRAIHCLNQFFGGLGGEEQADMAPQFVAGAKGPGLLVQSLSPQIEIIGTVIFGDNYLAEDTQERVKEVLALIEQHTADKKPELLLAGPAFLAGRYGMACGAICQAAQKQLKIAAVTAMFPENPGVDSYRKHTVIVQASENVMGMKDAIEKMTRVGLKLVNGEEVEWRLDGTIPHGIRQNYFAQLTGADRAVEMLLKKIACEPFETEYPMPIFDRVPPAPAVKDITRATIALVTSGGIVPRGNPDRIPSASAGKYGEYSLEGINRLSPQTHQTVHGGYDPTYANADPHRVLPLDVLRDLERAGRIGRLHNKYYATVGNATSVENAKRFGAEIAAKLVRDGVQAVILTST